MGRRRGFDEKAVVEAAMHQFRTTGYAGTTLDDISVATGLGRGSLYATFSGKRPLFLRSLQEYISERLGELEAALAGPDETAIDRLHMMFIAGARFVVDDEEKLGCMAGRFAHELAVQDAEVHQSIHDVFTAQHRMLADCAQAAQRHGDLEPGADTLAIGCLIVSLHRGFDAMAKAGIAGEILERTAEAAFRGLPLTARYHERH